MRRLFIFLLLISCNNDTTTPSKTVAPPAPSSASANVAPLPSKEITTNTIGSETLNVGWKIYKGLIKTEDTSNLVLSPASIHVALSMAANGAEGTVLSQLEKYLGMPLSALNKGWQENVPSAQGNVEFSMANRIYLSNEAVAKPGFLDKTKQFYSSEAKTVPFETKTEASRNIINQWVESKTNKKIKELIPQGGITKSTLSVLVNALYFKGDWLHAFPAQNTKSGPFETYHQTSTNVEYMKDTFATPYYGTKDFAVIELPYVGKEFSMFLYVPRGRVKLVEAEGGQSAKQWTEHIKLLKQTRITVTLPKFKATNALRLSEVLKRQRVTSIFDNGLNNISVNEPLVVSEIFHKTFIEVNETGTEAAAATAIAARIGGRPVPPPAVTFDRAFLFMIRENKSGLILMNGRIGNPSKE